MADEFMRAVAVIAAEDAELKADLKASETQVKQSVGRMQGDFDRLNSSANAVGSSAVNASGGVSVLGSAAALTGSQTLNAASQAGQLGLAFQMLGDTSKSATQQIRAMTVAAAKFLLTPVGMLLAIAAAFAFVAYKIYGVSKATGDYEKAMLSASDVAGKRWEKQLRATGKGADAAERAYVKLRAELAGPTAAAMHAYDEQIMAIHKHQQLLHSRMGQVGAGTEAAENMQREIVALAGQRALLAEQLSRKLQGIEDERRANELRAEEEQAVRLRAIHERALEIRRHESAELVTAWEQSPFGKVSAVIEGERARTEERASIRELLPTLSLTASMLAKVEAAFGLETLATAGPRGTGVSANAYAFGYAAMGGGGGSASVADTKAAETAKNTKELVAEAKQQSESLRKMATGAL